MIADPKFKMGHVTLTAPLLGCFVIYRLEFTIAHSTYLLNFKPPTSPVAKI